MTQATEVPAWYTRRKLANRWGVSEKTVSNWLSQARRAGLRPTREQYRRKERGEVGCIALIRYDYALAVWQRFGSPARVKKKVTSPHEVPATKFPNGTEAEG